jgi:hypothetical protein
VKAGACMDSPIAFSHSRSLGGGGKLGPINTIYRLEIVAGQGLMAAELPQTKRNANG